MHIIDEVGIGLSVFYDRLFPYDFFYDCYFCPRDNRFFMTFEEAKK